MDEQDLEDELDQLQQEQLDNKMLDVGNVPVSDAVHKMPTPSNAERKCRNQAVPGMALVVRELR